MHQYSLNFGNIKSCSVIEISDYLRFLHCVHIWDELAFVGAIMHGDVIYSMTFKPPQTCRHDFLQTEEYLLKQSGCLAEHQNHVCWC